MVYISIPNDIEYEFAYQIIKSICLYINKHRGKVSLLKFDDTGEYIYAKSKDVRDEYIRSSDRFIFVRNWKMFSECSEDFKLADSLGKPILSVMFKRYNNDTIRILGCQVKNLKEIM